MSDSYPGSEFDATWLNTLKPADHVNPQPQDKYHLVVIGGGTAGLICTIGAAGLGAKVAMVERHLMGGDCLNYGCVPSKALLEYTAHRASPDFSEAFSWLREVRAGIAPHDSVERYSELGADIFLGEARFVDPETVQVGDTTLRARRFAICTGARASIPPIPGLREANPLTNETVFDLRVQPRVIGILGAGAIGCELAQVFARLGTEVHLFELADRVLPLESVAASEALAGAMQALGVNLHLGAGVEKVEGETGAYRISAGGDTVNADQILVALGRQPNTDGLELDAAGVKLTERGMIEVDAQLRTSNKKIFSAGDCATPVQFTHHADAQARVVVQNALFAPTARADGLAVPRCTYTQPEVASIGANAETLDAQGTAYDRYAVDLNELDRGRAEPFDSGFAEVLTAKGKDEIIGATVVGPDAGEQLAPICLLMSNGLGLGAMQKVILSYPTRAEYLKRLSNDYNRTRLTPTVASAFKTWLRLTGG